MARPKKHTEVHKNTQNNKMHQTFRKNTFFRIFYEKVNWNHFNVLRSYQNLDDH